MKYQNMKYWFMFVLLYSPFLWGQEYQNFFPPEEFQARRAKVFEQIGKEAIAIVQGAADPGGYIYPRQTNTFYYLCGVENPYSYLVLDGRTRKTTLYLPRSRGSDQDRVLATNNPERTRELIGVDEVRQTDQLTALDAPVIYTPFKTAEGQGQSQDGLRARDRRIEADPWDGRSPRERHFIEVLKKRCPKAEIRDLSPILDELRSVKSPREIDLLRRAGQLSALALMEAMRSSEPGVYEYQLDAAARYVFLINGARLEGYRSITAAGVKNISDSHYYFNSCQLKDGDLVLMDYAPDFGYYVSDIGRMWPVNGKFQPWQRQICQFILDYHKEIIKRIRPGLTTQEIMAQARQVLEPKLDPNNFLKPEYARAARQLVERGGGVFSHAVGMSVHDIGRYQREPLKVGQVFAVDPQLRVPEENLYMRIEDTVVVTEDGVEVLTKWAPWELDEIEKLVQEKGIVQMNPPRFKSIMDGL
jgi:Xaa-Pro aminopeptidase